MEKLSNRALGNRAMNPPRILQFGGGNFLRAFTDWMVELMNQQGLFDGSIIVVKPTAGGDYQALRDQDGLFHVAIRGFGQGEEIQQNVLVQSIGRIVHPYNEYESYLELAGLKTLRFIVSNTTESGITLDEADSFSGVCPPSFPAKLTAFLYRRFIHFDGDKSMGMVVLPCELIESNGDKLKELILELAAQWDLEDTFVSWIHEACTFCNTLVDRIVPGYPNDPATYMEEIGYQDDLLVTAEPYHLWAIEGPASLDDELPLRQLGLNVHFTDDLSRYRTLKVRILNGSHTSMVPVGLLAGIDTVGSFMENEDYSRFLLSLLSEEIGQTLPYDQDAITNYTGEILDRFRNPFVQHRLSSIALNSIDKFKTRVLPSLVAYYQKFDALPSRMVLAFAALIRLYEGGFWQGEQIPLKDDEMTLRFFRDLWSQYRMDLLGLEEIIERILAKVDFWNQDLNKIAGLKGEMASNIRSIEQGQLSTLVNNLGQ